MVGNSAGKAKCVAVKRWWCRLSTGIVALNMPVGMSRFALWPARPACQRRGELEVGKRPAGMARMKGCAGSEGHTCHGGCWGLYASAPCPNQTLDP